MKIDKLNEPHLIEDTIECVEALAKILKENDLGKIKVSTEDIDIEIEGKRNPPPPHGIPHMPPIAPIGAVPPTGAPAPAEKPAEVPEKGNFITSPIIGTFIRFAILTAFPTIIATRSCGEVTTIIPSSGIDWNTVSGTSPVPGGISTNI